MASPFSNGAKEVTSQAPDAPDTTLVRAPEPTDPERKVGHDCEFVERPPKQFQSECSICLLILRDPHIISCCGHSFCEACIGRIREDGKPCPLCNKPGFKTMPNQGLRRSLNDFEVSCSHRELGCEWVGKLGSLDGHLNADPQPDCQLVGCHFVKLECNHCKTYVRRLAIAVHQSERCPKRPYTCEYCEEYESTFEDVASQHYAECKRFLLPCPNKCSPEGSGIERQSLEHHVEADCPLTIVDCSLRYAGCDVRLPRKELKSHMREDSSSHVALLAAENQMMAKQLQEKDQQLTKENGDLRSCIDQLKGELAGRDDALRQELADQHQKMDKQLLEKDEQNQDNVRKFTKENGDLRSCIDQLKGELVGRDDALRQELTDQHQKMDKQLLEKDEQIQDNVRKFTEENADLRSCIDELRGELARHQQHITLELAGRVDTLQLRELSDQHQQSEDNLKQELTVLVNKVHSLQRELTQQYQQSEDVLRHELAVLVKKADTLQCELADQYKRSKEELTLLRKKVDALHQELTAQCKQSEVNLTKQQDAIQVQEGEITALRKLSDQHQRELELIMTAQKQQITKKQTASLQAVKGSAGDSLAEGESGTAQAERPASLHAVGPPAGRSPASLLAARPPAESSLAEEGAGTTPMKKKTSLHAVGPPAGHSPASLQAARPPAESSLAEEGAGTTPMKKKKRRQHNIVVVGNFLGEEAADTAPAEILVRQPSEPSVKEFSEGLSSIRSKWYELGLALGINHVDLGLIEKGLKAAPEGDYLSLLLRIWITEWLAPHSWERIVQALVQIGDEDSLRVAREIVEAHGVPKEALQSPPAAAPAPDEGEGSEGGDGSAGGVEAQTVVMPDFQTQKEELLTLLAQCFKKGDTWFLVDMRWMKQWKRYVGLDRMNQSSARLDSAHPGPLDNAGLFKNVLAGTLKHHLMEELDYGLLPEAAWAKLLSWYRLTEGSRPIARKVVEYGLYMKHCKVEVYLLEFKLSMHPNITDLSAAYFSRGATVDDLKKALRLKFNIPEDAMCRVWHRYMTHTYELLSDQGQQTLQDAGLFNSQTIMLEQKNTDGTWPRSVVHNVNERCTHRTSSRHPARSSDSLSPGSSHH